MRSGFPTRSVLPSVAVSSALPPLRVACLVADGPPQRAFVHGLAQDHNVVGVLVQTSTPGSHPIWQRFGRYLNPLVLWRHLRARRAHARHLAASQALRARVFGPADSPLAWPSGASCRTTFALNDPENAAWLRALAPDVVCVNGTQLLRAPLLALLPEFRFGILNLHTGLSPYTRGGNCNLFALLEGRPEWVGITIHHIDEGIDSGDLVITEHVPMQAADTFEHIEVRAFEAGVSAMRQALHQLQAGTALRVPQWEKGRLYLRRTGYVYSPHVRYRVNRRLREGLVRDYLADREGRDAEVRLVGAIA